MLLIDKFLAQDTLLIVKVKEHAQVFSQLVVLLRLNNSLNLSLLRNLLSHLIHHVHSIFR